jgi:hypothetical protein
MAWCLDVAHIELQSYRLWNDDPRHSVEIVVIVYEFAQSVQCPFPIEIAEILLFLGIHH